MLNTLSVNLSAVN